MASFIDSEQTIEHYESGDESYENTRDKRTYQIPIEGFQCLSRLPESVDWRKHADFPPVRDQTDVCGACVVFAIINAIEWALFKVNGMKNFIRLSEQALIDCSWKQVISVYFKHNNFVKLIH